MSFDEYTDSPGQAVLSVVVTNGPEVLLTISVHLLCTGPNEIFLKI